MDESESLLKDGSDESSFLFLRGFFFLSCFFLFDDEFDKDFFDDESVDDGFGSGLSGTCLFSFSENSVGYVSGLFLFSRVIVIFSFSRVIVIFSFSRVNGIFSFSRVIGIYIF